MDDTSPLYQRLIYENTDKFYRLYLTVSEFRDKYYLHIRKYFLSYDSEWVPSREGISLELGIDNISQLLLGLIEISAQAEALDAVQQVVQEHLKSELAKAD